MPEKNITVFCISHLYPILYISSVYFNDCLGSLDKEKPRKVDFTGFFGFYRMLSIMVLVEAAGIEPASASPSQGDLHV